MGLDPNIQNIVLGAVTNGLTALVAHIGRKAGRALVGEQLLEKMRRNQTALQPILQRAADALAEKIEWEGPPRLEEVCLFLTSPEVETVLRQIYSARLSEDEDPRNLQQVREEFLTSFSLYVGLDKDRLRDSVGLLFEALLDACELALNTAVDDGLLSAHEAKSSLRHRIILGELAAAKKNLGLLTGAKKPDLQAVHAFDRRYRQQVAARHGFIVPPHFDTALKIPIGELYVSPKFITTPREKGQEPEQLKMSDFVSCLYRGVVLGDPGSGKSTFASKLCSELADRYNDRLFARRKITPVLVVLRDYGAAKRTEKCSILQFIETTANSVYQVQPPSDAFEYLLLNGRILVIFDGLDELLDTSYRQEVSNDIESFCTLYPSTPVLVTSRRVGYEQAPLDEEKFEVFHIAPFDENQVKEYVSKWFCTDADLTPEQQTQKAQGFLEESQIVLDLRSNPLMLALMCNIYRGENYIPRNRPDVYEKCATMLFERWDKSRGIHVPLPFEAHIRPSMMYLAHWIYAGETLQRGVPEKALVTKTTDYLCPRRFEDRDEGEKAAREFIEFCRGRAWVFTETGTTGEGERLYQFTHRTFLEYFTAAHMARTYPTPDKLAEAMLPSIAKREWDIVAQLAFQLQNKNVEGAGDQLLTVLLRRASRSKKQESWNLLSFAARCLEFMVPSPRVARDITTACLQFCLTGASRQAKEKRTEVEYLNHGGGNLSELVTDLLDCAAENRKAVADCLERLLIERIKKGSTTDSLLALEIGLYLNLCLRLARRQLVRDPEIREFWVGAEDRIAQACSASIAALRTKHFGICFDSFWRDMTPIADVIKWFGFDSLFRQRLFTIYPARIWSISDSVLDCLLFGAHRMTPRASFEKRLSLAKDVGLILRSGAAPRVVVKSSSSMIMHMLEEDFSPEEQLPEALDLGSDVLFGGFILMAVKMETLDRDRRYETYLDTVEQCQLSFFDFMRWTILARFREVASDKVQEEMERCDFTREQQGLVWRWVHREIDFVQKPTPA